MLWKASRDPRLLSSSRGQAEGGFSHWSVSAVRWPSGDSRRWRLACRESEGKKLDGIKLMAVGPCGCSTRSGGTELGWMGRTPFVEGGGIRGGCCGPNMDLANGSKGKYHLRYLTVWRVTRRLHKIPPLSTILTCCWCCGQLQLWTFNIFWAHKSKLQFHPFTTRIFFGPFASLFAPSLSMNKMIITLQKWLGRPQL